MNGHVHAIPCKTQVRTRLLDEQKTWSFEGNHGACGFTHLQFEDIHTDQPVHFIANSE